MTPGQAALGFLAGLMIATATAPVGVSGAVFLLPIQLSLLGVPSPSVTPTNLLFNVVAAPGALARYRRQGQLTGPLTRVLIAGTVPGVIIGSVIHVYLTPGPRAFRLVAAAVLLPIGISLLVRHPGRLPEGRSRFRPRTITVMGLGVGVAGGVYGIGGGSILGPILVSGGMSVAVVAPAALASTLVTSAVGAGTYAVLALTTPGNIAPDWSLGAVCGVGGLIGGYVGAWLQPRVSEAALRLLLGGLAVMLAGTYVVQAVG